MREDSAVGFIGKIHFLREPAVCTGNIKILFARNLENGRNLRVKRGAAFIGRVRIPQHTVGTMPAVGNGKLRGVGEIPGGAGGQNVNKVESGVRLRYQFKDPYTGEEEEILIENTETRDQPKNKENAMRQLRSILYDKELQHRMAEQAKVEAGKKKIEWGSQIRSYVFDDRRVKDHRTNYQTSDVNGVMDGKIEDFIKAYLMEFSSEEQN